MRGLKTIAGLLACSALAALSASAAPTKDALDGMTKIIGYFPEWGIYSGHDNYLPADVPFDKLTHINYAFATIKDGVIAHFDAYAAVEATHGEAWDSPYVGNLGQFEKLKARYPHLSMMVSVGGWTQSGNFHDVAATQQSRDRFAQSVVQYLRTYHMDGVDIDWEYPGIAREPDYTDNPNDQGTPNADATERETFTLLLQSLRAHLDQASELDGKYYQLSAAVGVGPDAVAMTDPAAYAPYLDFINLMTYDLYGAWSATTNHHSALYASAGAPDNLSIDRAVAVFEGFGIPAEKIIIGTPFYSRGWKGVQTDAPDAALAGLHATADGGAQGIWDGGRAAGVNPYYHLITMEEDPDFIKYYDESAEAPYLYSISRQEFYTYEDTRSLQAKVDYIRAERLGGIIIWELSGDVNGSVATPLLDVIASGLYPDGIASDTPDTNTTEPETNTTIPSPVAWDANSVYVQGDIVAHQGVTYVAQWWTQGDEPGTQEWGPWSPADSSASSSAQSSSAVSSASSVSSTVSSVSSSGSSDSAVTDCEATWEASAVYVAGNAVWYDGIHFTAKWWTQGDVPGAEEWGPWETSQADADACEPPGTSSSSVMSSVSSSSSEGSSSSAVSSASSSSTPPSGTISLSELQAQEAALTDTQALALARAAIATRDNAEVESIAPLRADNPVNVKRVEAIVDAAGWDYLFAQRASEYTYTNFLKAIGKFPAFCGDYDDGRDSEAICRRSLATMFAHFAQETGGHNTYSDVPEWRQGLVYLREVGWNESMSGGYGICADSTWQGSTYPCGTFDDGSYKSYFGRGAKQLSYNYNYGPFSEAMTGDRTRLLDHPEQVADTWYNLASAVFFYVYPQPPKPSMLHVIDGTWQPNGYDTASGLLPGFGVTTMIINGGIECGGSTEHIQSQNRIDYYREFSEYLGVAIPDDATLGCAGMQAFSAEGAGALSIYWEEDWSWRDDTADGRSYRCLLVGYQTPYSAFTDGDYIRCVEDKFDVIAQ